MMDEPLVNALIERLDTTPGPLREHTDVGKRLAYCQQVCPAWYRRCTKHPDTEEWITIMITPGRRCFFNWGGKFEA